MNDKGNMTAGVAVLMLAGLGLLVAGSILSANTLPADLLAGGGICLLNALNRIFVRARAHLRATATCHCPPAMKYHALNCPVSPGIPQTPTIPGRTL
jgi:hypothetical protein